VRCNTPPSINAEFRGSFAENLIQEGPFLQPYEHVCTRDGRVCSEGGVEWGGALTSLRMMSVISSSLPPTEHARMSRL
jgi:hypothetical protein